MERHATTEAGAMTELRHIAVITDYAELHEALRRRRVELGISLQTLNELSGVAADKILLPMSIFGAVVQARPIGILSLGPLLSSMGLRLIVAEDPELTARMRQRWVARDERRVLHAQQVSIESMVAHRAAQIQGDLAVIAGRNGNAARNAKLSPEVRRKIARKAARIRWRIERATRRGKAT